MQPNDDLVISRFPQSLLKMSDRGCGLCGGPMAVFLGAQEDFKALGPELLGLPGTAALCSEQQVSLPKPVP